MAKKDDKITNRQVDNLRTTSMKSAPNLLHRLKMSTLGEPATITCKCGEKHEIFPNQPTKLDANQVNSIKYLVSKIYPDLSPDDLATATGETLDQKGIKEAIGKMLLDPASYVPLDNETRQKIAMLAMPTLKPVKPKEVEH